MAVAHPICGTNVSGGTLTHRYVIFAIEGIPATVTHHQFYDDPDQVEVSEARLRLAPTKNPPARANPHCSIYR